MFLWQSCTDQPLTICCSQLWACWYCPPCWPGPLSGKKLVSCETNWVLESDSWTWILTLDISGCKSQSLRPFLNLSFGKLVRMNPNPNRQWGSLIRPWVVMTGPCHPMEKKLSFTFLSQHSIWPWDVPVGNGMSPSKSKLFSLPSFIQSQYACRQVVSQFAFRPRLQCQCLVEWCDAWPHAWDMGRNCPNMAALVLQNPGPRSHVWIEG